MANEGPSADYLANLPLAQLASSEDKKIRSGKTRVEEPSGLVTLKDLVEKSRKDLATRESALSGVMGGALERPERDLMAEALIAFAPALVGYGLGKAAGGIGAGEMGLAAGAKAGTEGLESLQKQREEIRKQKAENLKLRPEYKAYESEAERLKGLEKSYYEALGSGKKVTESGTQDVVTERQKEEQYKALKPVVPPSLKLQPHHKKIVDQFSTSYANQTGTAIALETLLQQISDPNIPKDLAIQAGLDSLKILNSSEGRDAVGVEEANRVGRFLQFNVMPNLTRPGPAFGRSMELFKGQVKNAGERARTRAARTQKEIESILSKYGEGANLPAQRQSAPAPSAPPESAASPAPKAGRSSAEIRKDLERLRERKK